MRCFVSAWIPILNLIVSIGTARIARAAQDQVEASQKPVIVLRIAGRIEKSEMVWERIETKQVVAVRVATTDDGYLIIANVGTGPALNLSFDFTPLTGKLDDPNRFARNISYFLQGSQIDTPISSPEISGQDYRFTAKYESLSGKKYVTEMVLRGRSSKEILFREDWKFKQGGRC